MSTLSILKSKENTHPRVNRVKFSERCPLISKIAGKTGKIAKRAGKITAGVVLVSAIAIGGANLGTYFDYVRNNYDYAKLGNKTKISLMNAPQNDALVEQAIRTVKLAVVGNAVPQEARLSMELDKANGYLYANYQMVWDTNKGVQKRDVEDIAISWKLDAHGKLVPERAVTRYHYKIVELDLPQGKEQKLVILIQNPAHTPGIPGSVLRYQNNDYGLVDIFTIFSADKWAGSCLSTGLPHRFGALEVEFSGILKQY